MHEEWNTQNQKTRLQRTNDKKIHNPVTNTNRNSYKNKIESSSINIYPFIFYFNYDTVH